jgi:hypothetical protein
MVESFWVIPDVANLRTPLSILREQAAALTDHTKGTLVGMVATKNLADKMEIRLEISVPSLNDYRFRILTYIQPIFEIYPGRLTTGSSEQGILMENEDELVSGLKAILASDRMKNVLASLLSQAVAA